jgi:Divergent InlB B-repeat domain
VASYSVPRRLGRLAGSTIPAIALVWLMVSTVGSAGAAAQRPVSMLPPPAAIPAALGPASERPSTVGAAPASTTQFLNGTFFSANSTFANTPSTSWPCSTAQWDNITIGTFLIENVSTMNCYGGAQSPSLLSLADGKLGVAYSVFTTGETACAQFGDLVVGRIGFQVSADGGKTYGPATYLGNQSCSELQAIEPSFTTSTNGNLYGVFVQENNTTRNSTGGLGITLAPNYGNRTADSLGFVRSSDSGGTFASVTTLTVAGSANIARPQIAAFGNSIYVVYDHLVNSTGVTLPEPYGYPTAYPISVDLVYSANGGSTWNGPYILPGLNASQGYTAQSPTISVNSAGKLAVAYSTNRGCFSGVPFCASSGDSIVVATSSSNGTAWSPPDVVADSVGETQCQGYDNQTSPNYWNLCYAYAFQMAPETTVAWSTTNTSYLYVGWSGMYGWTDVSGSSIFYETGNGGIWSAASPDGGASWTDSTVYAPEPALQDDNDFAFDPALAVRAGTVYLAYSVENQTYCPSTTCPFSYAFYYELTNSTDGVTWNAPDLLSLDPVPSYDIFDSWTGYNDAVGFSSSNPVVSFAMPLQPLETFAEITTYVGATPDDHIWENDTGETALTVVSPWTGATAAVTFAEKGLAPGTSWGFGLGPVDVETIAASVQIGDVPIGQSLLLDPGIAGATGAYRTQYGATLPPSSVLFNGPANETIAYSLEYGVALSVLPSFIGDFDFYFQANGQYYDFDIYAGTPYVDPSFPWYFANGTVIPMSGADMYSSTPISYFNGTGNGSSTTTGNSTSITVNGPINETLWGGAFGSYEVTFAPEGLTSAETYGFDFAGTSYQAAGTTNISVGNVLTGAYSLTGVSASAPTAGWEYFGEPSSGSPVVVPEQTAIALNFSYAYVDLAAAPGTISFHASGLVPGDVWRLSFNGTAYGSSTPWINITTRPGTYAVQAYPIAASANDTTEYAPGGFGPTISVTPGGNYSVPYVNAYRVQAFAGTGGTITGGGTSWIAPGSQANFTATAQTNYRFLGWVGEGAGAYTGPLATASITVGGPITEAASFEALPVDHFNLSFSAVGLPSGTWWTVGLNGAGYATNGSTLVVGGLYPCSSGATGSYRLTVAYAYPNGSAGTRFVPRPPQSTVCTSGSTQVILPFAPEYLVTPLSTPGGSAAVEVAGLPSASSVWVDSGTSVTLEVTIASGYEFSGWIGSGPGNYTGASGAETIVPSGPVTETAYFQAVPPTPTPVYNFSFRSATVLSSGTAWSVTVDGVGYSSTTGWINLTGVSSGRHAVQLSGTRSPDGLTEYTPTSGVSSIDLPSEHSVTVSFSRAFWVSTSSTAGGYVNGSTNAFLAAGSSFEMNAVPGPGESFAGWTGNGTGAYTGPEAEVTVTVNAPVSELASFVAVPPHTSAPSGGPWTSPAVIAGFAVAGLAGGLIVAVLVFRRRGRPATEPSPPVEST